MRGKFVLTFLAGLIVGAVVSFAGWAPRALAQRPENQQRWDYKVVAWNEFEDDLKGTKKLNQLADDGWEYVGVVSTSVPVQGRFPGVATTVAFRRAKK